VFAEKRNVRPCARHSACISVASTGSISVKFGTGDFYEKPVERLQILVKIGQNYRALYMKN
jgi:hypothetical protein